MSEVDQEASMAMQGKVRIKEATLSAKVIRADGTVEDLGVVASTNKVKLIKSMINRYSKRLIMKIRGY